MCTWFAYTFLPHAFNEGIIIDKNVTFQLYFSFYQNPLLLTMDWSEISIGMCLFDICRGVKAIFENCES